MAPIKYLLAGGINSGKTTTLKILGNKGYNIIPEAAELLIKEAIGKNKKHPDIENKYKFVEKVLEKRIELESQIKEDQIYFIDRGIPDGLAYYKLYKIPITETYRAAIEKYRYDKVFFFDLLDNYKPDESIRIQNIKERKIIHGLLEETYTELGYELIHVPLMPIEERVNLIIKNI